MSEKIYLGGLWLKETRDGDKYMSGSFGIGGKLLVFRNDHKQADTDPDYKLYMVAKADNRDAPQELTDENLPF